MMKNEKLLHNIEQLDRIFSKNSCLLYGAGKVARAVVKYAAIKKFQVDKILVSTLQGNDSEVMGIPVMSFHDYQGIKEDRCVLVAVMENLHNELEAELENSSFSGVYFLSDELYRKLVYFAGDYELDCVDRLQRIENEIAALENRIQRFVPRPCLEYMVLNILDHCNLRCKGCDHFACVADPYFVSYETIHQDLERLSEIFHEDYIMKIAVMGGEPLLHPDLLRILEDVRAYFPYTTIRLTTNGLLLLQQPDEFWRVCRENRVTIVNTKYPISLDFDRMKEKAADEGVKFQFFEGTGEGFVKKSFKKIINLRGDGDPVESFAQCHVSNRRSFLMEGKLYGCPFSCQSYRIFNDKFHQNLHMTEKDYLDIYKVSDMQEIFEFAARPKFYCRYCKGLSPLFDWERSERKMSEWVEE